MVAEKFSIDSAAVNKKMMLADKVGIIFSLFIAAQLRPLLPLPRGTDKRLDSAAGKC